MPKFFNKQNFNIFQRAKSLIPPFPKTKGFTLIELLIVLSIIGIISSIVIASYTVPTRRQEVKAASGDLKVELRKLQNFATSVQKNPNNTSPCSGQIFKSYLVIAGPPLLYRSVYIAEPPPPPNCFSLLSSEYPFNTEKVVVENVGTRDGPTGAINPSCWIAWIHFRPLNRSTNLHCGFLVSSYLNPDTPTSISDDRIYIQLKHTNSSETIRYRVYVTTSGVIYEERQ